jgi:hypothetical protein
LPIFDYAEATAYTLRLPSSPLPVFDSHGFRHASLFTAAAEAFAACRRMMIFSHYSRRMPFGRRFLLPR